MASDEDFGLNLAKISEDSLKRIKDEWLTEYACGEDDVSKFDYEQLFELIESTRAYGPLNSKYNMSIYFALEDTEHKTHALVELVQSKRNREVWIKVIDIYISPAIEFCLDIAEAVRLRTNVFACTILGIFKMVKAGVDIFKVYGRTENFLNFLRVVQGAMTANEIERKTGVSTSIEGRWLVFKA